MVEEKLGPSITFPDIETDRMKFFPLAYLLPAPMLRTASCFSSPIPSLSPPFLYRIFSSTPH